MRKKIYQIIIILTMITVLFSSCSSKDKNFRYFFRGFITLTSVQISEYPTGTYVIKTDEDWHDFMDKYVPGIPYYETLDFSKNYLVIDIKYPSSNYSSGVDIKSFHAKENKIEVEYINDPQLGESNGIYIQNSDSIEHCYINIIMIEKSKIPSDIENVYVK